MHLTPAEKDILGSIAKGKSLKEIAVLRSRSRSTVQAQIRHLLVKLHAVDQAHAVAKAVTLGLLPLTDDGGSGS